MPNGHDKNWMRTCFAIDGYRAKYGRWPKRVRMIHWAFADVVGHLLTPAGFAVVSSFVELVPEEEPETPFIADDGGEAEFRYGTEEPPRRPPDPLTFEWFGQAVLRDGPSELDAIESVD